MPRQAPAVRVLVLSLLVVVATALAGIAAAHGRPVFQTVANGKVYASVTGPLEIYWPYRSDGSYGGFHVEADGSFSANLLLKPTGTEGSDCAQRPLPPSVIACGAGAAVAAQPVACPVRTFTDACARLSLAFAGALAPGSYDLVRQVVHGDGYVERAVDRFTVDPSYVAPTPSIGASPSAQPSPSPAASPGASASPLPSASAGATVPPSATLPPSAAPGDSASGSASPSVGPGASPSPTPAPLPATHDPYTLDPGQWALLAVALPLVAAASALTARRGRRG